MSGSRPLRLLVAEYLRTRPGERLKVKEIAEGLLATHPDRFAEKQRGLGGRTSLVDQLTREIYAQKNSILQTSSDVAADASRQPLRLFIEAPGGLQAVAEKLGVAAMAGEGRSHAPQPHAGDEEREERSEHSLYGPLQRFLSQEMRVVSRRIRESTSSNRRGRNGNKWLHPGLAGMLAPGQGWADVVRQCSMALPTRKARLIGIEVKLRLTAGDVREAFFQTVSNSLWANRAYLAAVEIKGADTLQELETLCSLHGVGYISIDPTEIAESRVVIPAREREEVDWASVNRIAEENDDFRAYLSDVLNYLQTGKVMTRLWEHAGDA